MSSSCQETQVDRIGIIYIPPTIIAQYQCLVRDTDSISSNTLKVIHRHTKIRLSLKHPNDPANLVRKLSKRLPSFFGHSGSVKNDQLLRIICKLLSNSKCRSETSEEDLELKLSDKGKPDLYQTLAKDASIERRRYRHESDEYQYDVRKDFGVPCEDSSWD